MDWINILELLPGAFGFYLGYWLEKRTEKILNRFEKPKEGGAF